MEEEEATGDLRANSEESYGDNPGGKGMADWMVKQQRQLLRDQLFPL